MSNEKLYEYLTEIGVLLFDNIDLFLNIHSIKNEKDFKNEAEKLKDSLFQYLQKTSKDDNLLRLMSQFLIDSYYKSQAVSKYKALKNLINIYQNKLFLIYNNFFINISIYIMNKSKATTNEENKDKKKRTISDDNILRKSQEKEDKTFKKIPKSAKTKSRPKKKTPKPKMTNQYKNNYYMNIQESNINPHSFFVNNNNDNIMNIYQNPNRENTSVSIDNYGRDIYDDNIISYKYYSPMVNIQSKKPINNYALMNNNQNSYDNILPINMDDNNNINYNINSNLNNNNINNINNDINNLKIEEINNQTTPQVFNNNMFLDTQDDYDFFDNEQKHIEKVQNKIMNLKNERITKIEEQCTFTPQINNTYKLPKNENNINTFDKLYNDSSINKLKKEERIKKYLEGFKFTPNIEKNDKYQIKLPFDKRLEKSIENKKNYRNEKLKEQDKKLKEASIKKNKKVNEKDVIERLYGCEYKKIMDERKKNELKKKDNKKPVINWKKKYKDYYVKYPEGDDYKRQLEKRKKILNSINTTNNNDNKKNKVIDYNEFFKEKEENKNNNINYNNIENTNGDNKNFNDDEGNNSNNEEFDNNNNDNFNNDDNLNNNMKIKKVTTAEDVQEAINEAYKSVSIKNLLNENNNFFKNEQ